jgi:hypothetical protein
MKLKVPSAFIITVPLVGWFTTLKVEPGANESFAPTSPVTEPPEIRAKVSAWMTGATGAGGAGLVVTLTVSVEQTAAFGAARQTRYEKVSVPE